ncbi:hypothetical protein [Sphaerisporangium krabiense]|uniref:Copper resistance protein CopC n=1 Tax=Sphaerisporangium krabiense TaxID=763782 RepID=A0A7W8ZBI3_9ACTN|nr:hypothetical protein [Sphaerisporangium krabiense]MBB5630974.1 hypothetical protein [Sphaerisporangium krabiense]
MNALRFGVLGGLVLALLGTAFPPAGAPAGQAPVETRQVAAAVEGARQADDYYLTINPLSRTVVAGGNVQYTVALVMLSGNPAPFAVVVNQLPASVIHTFNPNPVPPGSSSTLTLMTAPTTPAGTYSFVVTATMGMLTRSAFGQLTVIGPE